MTVLHNGLALDGKVGVGALVQRAHGVLLAVIDKIEEGGIVSPVHIHTVALDILADVFAAGIHGMFQRQGAAVVAGPRVVDPAVIAVAVGAVVVVKAAVVVLDGILLHHDALALVDVERLPGQNQAEELVAPRADGPDLLNILIIVVYGHEAGDAALHLDLKQHLRRRKPALGPRRRQVVDHNRRDALALRVGIALGLAGKDVGLIGGQGGRGGGGGGRRLRRRGTGHFFVAGGFSAGDQQHTGRHNRQQAEKYTLHGISSFLNNLEHTGAIVPRALGQAAPGA